MPKTTEQHRLIVFSGKSDAAVTNNKRLCLIYCTVEVNFKSNQIKFNCFNSLYS